MTARSSLVYMDGFPKVPAKLYEGTLTLANAMVGGLKVENVQTYSAPIVKGDLVRIKAHTETGGVFLVEKAAAANDADTVIGMCIDDPIGNDGATATGQTPAAAYRRTATIALFGIGVIELTTSETGAVAPGDSIALDESENNQIETDTAFASIAKADNGSGVALTYAATGTIVAVLIGFSGAFVAD
jgi:hypothetical protein